MPHRVDDDHRPCFCRYLVCLSVPVSLSVSRLAQAHSHLCADLNDDVRALPRCPLAVGLLKSKLSWLHSCLGRTTAAADKSQVVGLVCLFSWPPITVCCLSVCGWCACLALTVWLWTPARRTVHAVPCPCHAVSCRSVARDGACLLVARMHAWQSVVRLV